MSATKLAFTPRVPGSGSPAADINTIATAHDALIDDVAVNAAAIALKADKAALAAVATTGNYTDLANKPILAVPDTFSVMPYAASVVVDFNLETVRTLAATGNIAFGPSLNTALLKTKEHYITNTTAAAITLAFPAGWVFVPGPAPTTLAAGKLAILSLMSLGTSDSTIKAAYVAQA